MKTAPTMHPLKCRVLLHQILPVGNGNSQFRPEEVIFQKHRSVSCTQSRQKTPLRTEFDIESPSKTLISNDLNHQFQFWNFLPKGILHSSGAGTNLSIDSGEGVFVLQSVQRFIEQTLLENIFRKTKVHPVKTASTAPTRDDSNLVEYVPHPPGFGRRSPRSGSRLERG